MCAELHAAGALHGDGGREAGPGGAQHLQPHVRVRPRAHIPGGHCPVDNIYLLFVIISTGLYLQLPRPGGHEQDETRVDSYPIWLLSVINC